MLWALRYNPSMDDKTRSPIVAGMFYPADPSALRDAVSSLLEVAPPISAPTRTSTGSVGLIVPHAGYVYSGAVAAAGYAYAGTRCVPGRVIVLGANHSGLGAPVSLASDEAWRTPLGDLPLDAAFIHQLLDAGLVIDDSAFLNEHSIEVQLPFVQALWGSAAPLVPICVKPQSLQGLIRLGRTLADVSSNTPTLIVASSDFTHYEPHDVATERDRLALEPILALDVEGFLTRYYEKRLSICGAGAIAATMEFARTLDLADTHLLSYATSGDTSGEYGAVVGYAAVSLEGAT